MSLYCNACGARNSDTSRYCAVCGEEITPGSTGDELAPGSVIGNRYTIISLIKAGGMGAVYRATDSRLDRICAVKELFSNYEDSEEEIYAIKRFNSEATILSKLQHDHLPVVYDYFIENGYYYLVMSFIEGEDLDTILEREGNPYLTEDKVVEWAKQILTVLDYLHNQNPSIIYRDIKPANIMIRETDKRAMLVDFGIARVLNPEQRVSKTAIGTDGYAPKEQYKGQVEPRSDIYALGATMHHLLTGEIPVPLDFEPVSVFNPEISMMLDQIIMKALEKEVYNRFENARDMLDALNTYKQINVSRDSGTTDDIFDLQIDEEEEEEASDDIYDLEIEDELSSGALPPLEEEEERDEGVLGGVLELEWTGDVDPAALPQEEQKTDIEHYDTKALEEFEKDFEKQIRKEDSSQVPSQQVPSQKKRYERAAFEVIEEAVKDTEEEKEYIEQIEEVPEEMLNQDEEELKEEEIYEQRLFKYIDREAPQPLVTDEEKLSIRKSQKEKIKKDVQITQEVEKDAKDSEEEEILNKAGYRPSYEDNRRKTGERQKNFEAKTPEKEKTPPQEPAEEKIITITPRVTRKKLEIAETREKPVEKQKSFTELLKPFGSNLPTSIVHPIDEAEMIYIPAGPFLMGSNNPDDDNPETWVYLYAYYIDKYPVNNFRYNMFLQATNHIKPANWNYSPMTADHPVTGVTWLDAKAYADWADKRLPTEAEWEKAARGIDGRIFPWGNEWDKYKCNNWNMDDPDMAEKMLDICNERGTMAVGCYSAGASPYGVMDMSGNVSEWCADWYSSSKQDPTFEEKEKYKNHKICKGGSWRDAHVEAFRIPSRRKSIYDKCFDAIGFRCCQTPRNLKNKE